ncbi:Hypothetical predicted protein [Paramuricea clavata]|uniref:Uncharacterized protein n=1 Tax=Paramuricea clavata TaxID=317549 RepID=A0A6S7JCW3_PARCT|nr:Hypothetical predicted protein [Paramuricea clavata]
MPVGRPNPVFDEHTDFDCDEWFATNEEKNESDLKNLTWILTRMLADEKIIPGWAAFNEVTCQINHSIAEAIGQHMENAGLLDVWVESGLFACSSTDQIMEGKSYYRAVRGHTLAYYSLNRIYWNYFVKWVGTQEHLKTPELRMKIGEIVQEFSKGDIDSKIERCLLEIENEDEDHLISTRKDQRFWTGRRRTGWWYYGRRRE